MEMYAAHYPPGYDFPISTLFLDVLGELVQTTAGEWITHPPTRCPNGHTLGPNQVLVGHGACLDHGGGGHQLALPNLRRRRVRATAQQALRTHLGYRAVIPITIAWLSGLGPPVGLAKCRNAGLRREG
jgi:hypothetical protein